MSRTHKLFAMFGLALLFSVSPLSAWAGDEPTIWNQLGHLHPVILHFPIAWLILLVFIDLGAYLFNRAGWERWGLYTHILTLLACLPAVGTGVLLEEGFEDSWPDATHALAEQHELLMFIVTGVIAAALVWRLAWRNQPARWGKAVYLLLLLAAVGLIGYGAHLGGILVHGEDFFKVFSLPF